MPTDPKKNLFDYATKELSQDAFLRWLIESTDDPSVSPVSKKFLRWLIGKTGDIRVVRTAAQWHHIDIVAELECSGRKILLAIEDKVGSGEHNQLQKYNQKLEEWKRQNGNAELVKVFYKTSFLECSEKTRVDEAEWTIFDLGAIARFFTSFTSFPMSEIIRSYAAHVVLRYKEATEVSHLPMKEWKNMNFQTWFRKQFRSAIERQFPNFSLEDLTYQGYYYSVFASRSFRNKRNLGVCLEISFRPEFGIVGWIHQRRGNPEEPLLLEDHPWEIDTAIRSEMVSLVSRQAAVPWSSFKNARPSATTCIGSIRNVIPFDGETPESILHKLLGILKEFNALFDDNREQLLSACARATTNLASDETRPIVRVSRPLQNQNNDVRTVAAATMAASLGIDQRRGDIHNNQVLLMQFGNKELLLRFTNVNPHVRFNFWVDNAAAFARQYGAELSQWGKAHGFLVVPGHNNRWGDGVQFMPRRVVDIENLDCEALRAMGNLIIKKLRETIR